MIKKWTLFIGLPILVSIFVLGGLNLIDSKPRQEVASLLSEPLAVPTNLVPGYKYYLGFGAYPGDDPAILGEEVYGILRGVRPSTTSSLRPWSRWSEDLKLSLRGNSEVRGSYLRREDFQQRKVDLERAVGQFSSLVDRYSRLIEMPGMGADFSRSIASGTTLFALLDLGRLKLAEINLVLDQGDSEKALQELKKMFAFHRASLEGNNFLVETMIHLALLKSIKTFAQDAAKDRAAFRALLKADPKAFYAEVDERALLANVQKAEIGAVHSIFKNAAGKLLNDSGTPSWAYIATRLTPNRVLNDYYQCWNAGAESLLGFTIFPVTQAAARLFCSGLAPTRESMSLRAQQLRAPLDL